MVATRKHHRFGDQRISFLEFFEILLIFHDRIDSGAVGGENHISEDIDDDGEADDDDDADDVSERMMACKFKHRDGKN